MAQALILGVGNILMQDEGIGVRALEWLQACYACAEVKMIDGGTMGLDLLHYLPGLEHLLILDAVEAGKAAGEITILTGQEAPAFFGMKISPHQMGVQDLLATAQLLGYTPPAVVILGVQPAQLNVGLDMSPAVTVQVEPLARLALVQLAEWGYQMCALTEEAG
ncbi:MAG: HyaD/HybD family hydrogenase maturation endopeptidase [Chloroflexota bacterium]